MSRKQQWVKAPVTRSQLDAVLEKRVAVHLGNQRFGLGSAIRIHAEAGTVTVSGRLPSSRQKWLCLNCCHRVAGVVKLVDHLVVRPGLPHLAPTVGMLKAA